MELNKIHLKSCLDGMVELDDNSVDLIMTSPPYPKGMRKYEMECSVEPQHYVAWIKPFLNSARRVLKLTGSMVLVLMDKIVDGEIHPYIDNLKKECRKMGFGLIDDIIWAKSNTLPNVDYSKRPIRTYEHCLWFVKNTKLYTFNGDMIRQPYAETTLKRYQPGNPETLHKRSGGQANQTWVGVKPNKKGAASGNVIYGARFCGRNPGHPAKYPDYLPEWFIKTLSYPKEIVLDPFTGSGTTLIVAKKAGRNYIGYEISEKYYKRAIDDLNNTWHELEIE